MKEFVAVNASAYFAYIVAFAVPFVTGFLARSTWTTWAKFGLAAGLSLAIGAATIAITGNDWEWEWSVPFLLSIVGASEVYFRAFVDAIPGLKKWLAENGNRPKG